MISSAVVVPEAEDFSPTTASHKRRQSSTSYSDSFKRPRLDIQPNRDSNGDTFPSSAISPPRRKSSVTSTGAAEERKRGQRLFGALLGTLSQSSTTTAQRRRADIEKKQLGKLQQRGEELEQEKKEKREKLDVVRRKEQRVWDEQSMRIRHRNMLAEAHFLRTKAGPRLFYKPWELRPEEEDQIKRQVADVSKAVEAELEEHPPTKRADSEDTKGDEVQHPPSSASQFDGAEATTQPEDQMDTKEHNEQPRSELARDDNTDHKQTATQNGATVFETATNETQPHVKGKVNQEENGKQEEKSHDDHGGEELVEGQEDDVMY